MNKKVLFISGFVALLLMFFIYEKFFSVPQYENPIIRPKNTQNNSPKVNVALKDGSFSGDEVNSMYGPAQAQITVTSGKITDVQFLKFPNDRPSSAMKSNAAMPVIKSEVIQSQSANVNTVSGATETSSSLIQSVASAISKAS